MSSMWKKNFTKKPNVGQPKKILEDQGLALGSLTSGKVFGIVEPFSSTNFIDQWSNVSETAAKLSSHPTQSILGEKGNARSYYEFYITSEATPNYKFRVLFISFDISIYPIELIVEKSICDELGTTKERITCENEQKYCSLLESILNSTVITEIVNKLLSLN